MKRIITFVLSVLCAAFFTTVFAQQNIFVWKNGGILSVKSAAEIDSMTSSINSPFLDVRTSEASLVTTYTFVASINVSFANNVKSLSQNPEVGICFSSINTTPTFVDRHICQGRSIGNYNFTIYELEPGTTYYYRAYVKLGDEVFYGNVNSIMTLESNGTIPTDTLINGHKFVDLGLPSGLLWARSNVGASSSSDDGDYFAWGETESKSCYSWDTYKWGRDYNNLSKYNYSDGKTTLALEDDVATIKWGTPCRMPSMSELQELYSNCDWSWQSTYNGTSGFLITGPNGNTIFFPASGYRNNGSLEGCGSLGYYWSCSLSSDNTHCAYDIDFFSGRVNPSSNYNRYHGFSVRPVAKK